MNPLSKLEQPTDLIKGSVVWHYDAEDVGWFVAAWKGSEVFLRMNNFPEENLYSLWIGDGRWIELETMPTGWSIAEDEDDWPSTARPKRPRSEFP